MTVREFFIDFFLLFGGFLTLTAAVGLVRFPDLYTRMQATTKASSLGLVCMLAAAMLYFRTTDVWVRGISTTLFIFITAPVSAHLLAKAAYLFKVPLWEKTVIDEYKGTLEKPAVKSKVAPRVRHEDPRDKISEIFRRLREKKID